MTPLERVVIIWLLMNLEIALLLVVTYFIEEARDKWNRRHAGTRSGAQQLSAPTSESISAPGQK